MPGTSRQRESGRNRSPVRPRGLLRALAAWGSENALELRFSAYPDFTIRQRGRLRITMILRVSAASRAEAREEAAAECLSLRATLKTHMPEAEFAPITDTGELVGP